MQLPALTPKSLEYPTTATNDAMLFELLVKRPVDLIAFFELACGDETWTRAHSPFIQDTLYWMTREILEDKLSYAFVQRIALAIQKHYAIVSPFVDLNIILELGEHHYPVSGILLVASSPHLRDRLLAECRSTGISVLTFDKIEPHLFEMIIEAINKGMVENLWRYEQRDILALLQEAHYLDLDRLQKQCQEGLLRYISRINVVQLLQHALDTGYPILREGCLNYLNNTTPFANFPIKDFHRIEMEFLEFNDDTLELCSLISPLLTHLSFRGGLTAEASFNQVIDEAPKLKGVDIGGTHTYSDRLTLLPPRLAELGLDHCDWLTQHRLELILKRCPHLKSLSLSRDTSLTTSSWSLLNNLKELLKLDISHCDQVNDDALKLILLACRHLEEIDLSECKHISNKGFYEIAYNLKELTTFNCRGSRISDAPLVEIATRSTQLRNLDIRGCEELSDHILHTLRVHHPNVQVKKRRNS